MATAELEQEVFVDVTPRSSDEAARQEQEQEQEQEQRFLHDDDAPSNTSLIVQQLLAQKNIPVITQPPRPPDLAPGDNWLFLL
jgi:hypothetical protein